MLGPSASAEHVPSVLPQLARTTPELRSSAKDTISTASPRAPCPTSPAARVLARCGFRVSSSSTAASTLASSGTPSSSMSASVTGRSLASASRPVAAAIEVTNRAVRARTRAPWSAASAIRRCCSARKPYVLLEGGPHALGGNHRGGHPLPRPLEHDKPPLEVLPVGALSVTRPCHKGPRKRTPPDLRFQDHNFVPFRKNVPHGVRRL